MVFSQFDGHQRPHAQPAGTPDAHAASHPAHSVQFYGNDEALLRNLVRAIGANLGGGGAVLLVATPTHLEYLESNLRNMGLDPANPAFGQRYLTADATALASQFMRDGYLDASGVERALTGFLDRVKPLEGSTTLIFGELVAVLWDRGFRDAALEVEGIWNDLARTRSFTLQCAYPMESFDPIRDADYIREIRDIHTEDLTADSHALHVLRSRDSQVLQAQAQSLAAATERQRRAESDLARQRADFSELMEHTLDGIQQIGADQHILWANRAVLDLLKYPADAYIGHSLREFLVDGVAFDDWFARLTRGETLVDLPVTMLASDGTERYVRLFATHGHNPDGDELPVYRLYTRDFTGRIQMEQVLRDRNRDLRKAIAARDEFLSVAAHELKTPATTLRAYTQLLLRDLRRHREISQVRLETSLSAIEAQSKKLDHLVARLLDSGQIDEGRLRIIPEATDIAALIRSVADAQRATARHDIRVESPDQFSVLVDRVRFEQVITNLLSNAVKFSPDGGRITLELGINANGAVQFAVTDEGIGVTREQQSEIFSRFYQGAGQSHLSGLGLGLYITREIVKLHGGEISVEQTGRSGARFVVTLPASLVIPAHPGMV